jgi:hypothetical protein
MINEKKVLVFLHGAGAGGCMALQVMSGITKASAVDVTADVSGDNKIGMGENAFRCQISLDKQNPSSTLPYIKSNALSKHSCPIPQFHNFMGSALPVSYREQLQRIGHGIPPRRRG